MNKHDCLPSQRCDNTIGSFHCIRYTSCGTGYTLNAQTGLCEGTFCDDEPKVVLDCFSLLQKLLSDCILPTDDDECSLGTDNCRNLGPTWQCRNTLGSFRCERKRCDGKKVLLNNGECKLLECPTGYEASQQGQCIGKSVDNLYLFGVTVENNEEVFLETDVLRRVSSFFTHTLNFTYDVIFFSV